MSAYLLVGMFILLMVEKGEVEVWINQFHAPFFDYFFQYITHLGDWLFAVLFILGLALFWKLYYAILTTICLVTSTLVVQMLKRLVFEDVLRPSKFFEGIMELYYIEGIEIHTHFSFPSGHTSGAFTLFTVLTLLVKKPGIQLLCFFLAFLVGVSRMYLLQHFFIDTYFGTLLGVLFTLLSYFYVQNNTNLKYSPKLQKPIINTGK